MDCVAVLASCFTFITAIATIAIALFNRRLSKLNTELFAWNKKQANTKEHPEPFVIAAEVKSTPSGAQLHIRLQNISPVPINVYGGSVRGRYIGITVLGTPRQIFVTNPLPLKIPISEGEAANSDLSDLTICYSSGGTYNESTILVALRSLTAPDVQ